MNKKNPETLSDKISGILNITPTVIDPENDIYEDTAAKVVANDFEDGDSSDEYVSKFRKQNVQLLDDEDERYSGKRSSRKNFQNDFEESTVEEESNELRIDNSDEEQSQTSSGSDEADSNESDVEEHVEENDDFKHMKESNVTDELEKGKCVGNQLNIWENLLETRIRLQKCLIPANKMPPSDVFHKIKCKDDKFTDKAGVVTQALSEALNKMLDLQSIFLKQYPETKSLLSANNKPSKRKVDEVDENTDEEIPSDTDNDELESDNNIDEEIESNPPNKKLKTLDNFENELNKRHMLYIPYRNKVIQKWNDKTKIASAKHNISNTTILDQIEFVLRDKEKAIKRTQQMRSHYEIVGRHNSTISVNDNAHSDNSVDTHCTEIFDDDDFYHQLLRELIEFKSADITDPVQLSRQWIQLQSVRSKMKRKIDTKATKGRKVRYTVHSKLVNFMAPIQEYNNWTDDAKTQLYKSLFGSNLSN